MIGPKRVPGRKPYQRPPKKSSGERGYGTLHRKIRARYLAQHPICEHCQDAWSTVLHHKDHNQWNTAENNLAAWCLYCHTEYHRQCSN